MIDFRYHLVSLISIFLALAVGMVIGAGALRGNLGEQLSGQVQQLRTEKDDYRRELDQSAKERNQLVSYLQGLAPKVLEGTLNNKSVAVVSIGQDSENTVEATRVLLRKADVEEINSIHLDERFFEAEDAELNPVLTKIREHLPYYSNRTVQVREQLVEFMFVALQRQNQQLSNAPVEANNEQRQAILNELIAAGLIRYDGNLQNANLASDAIIIEINGAISESELPVEKQSLLKQATAGVVGTMADWVNRFEQPAVFAGTLNDATASDGEINKLRADKSFKNISTVDSINRIDGQINTVLAAIEAIKGKYGAYGYAPNATSSIVVNNVQTKQPGGTI